MLLPWACESEHDPVAEQLPLIAWQPPDEQPQTRRVALIARNTRFDCRDHFIASVEMQLSGEPLAEMMGRDLSLYSRDHLPSDRYFGAESGVDGRVDLAGFSSGVESYEYSKQPMNNVSFESGAGVSLAFGPLLNPDLEQGTTALSFLRNSIQNLASLSNLTGSLVSPHPSGENPLGWRGLWPVLHPFTSFDPSISPTNHVDLVCSISSDDDPGATGNLVSNDYECDYSSLHLPNRTTQVSFSISPGASGWLAWKQALWTINYLQVMHDSAETAVVSVPEEQLPQVGEKHNHVGGTSESGAPAATGTYLGSSNIEGFQAGLFLTILDNQAAHWLASLTTLDGQSLSGFRSLEEALRYSKKDPIRWIANEISVVEVLDQSGFPRPSRYQIAEPNSDTLALSGLLGAFASAYALTDRKNHSIGATQAARAYFDGDPFIEDNQLADAEPTLHDRSLALIRLVVVNLLRLHQNAQTGMFADSATFSQGKWLSGDTASINVAAYTLFALRTARRSLDSSLGLYTNTRPDTAGIPTPLDAFELDDKISFDSALTEAISMLSACFYDRFTTALGGAYGAWDLTHDTPLGDDKDLDSYTAAIRGLFTAYLATGDTKYRDRALLVFQSLETHFYDTNARLYQPRADLQAEQVTYTPRRFGLLQASLRDTYELVATLPGKEPLRPFLERRIARLNKLVLNGWDDRNQNEIVDYPSECIAVVDDIPQGSLQMAERTLSGDTGTLADNLMTPRIVTVDRERDCVPEISAAHLPSALAQSVTFSISSNSQ